MRSQKNPHPSQWLPLSLSSLQFNLLCALSESSLFLSLSLSLSLSQTRALRRGSFRSRPEFFFVAPAAATLDLRLFLKQSTLVNNVIPSSLFWPAILPLQGKRMTELGERSLATSTIIFTGGVLRIIQPPRFGASARS